MTKKSVVNFKQIFFHRTSLKLILNFWDYNSQNCVLPTQILTLFESFIDQTNPKKAKFYCY